LQRSIILYKWRIIYSAFVCKAFPYHLQAVVRRRDIMTVVIVVPMLSSCVHRPTDRASLRRVIKHNKSRIWLTRRRVRRPPRRRTPPRRALLLLLLLLMLLLLVIVIIVISMYCWYKVVKSFEPVGSANNVLL